MEKLLCIEIDDCDLVGVQEVLDLVVVCCLNLCHDLLILLIINFQKVACNYRIGLVISDRMYAVIHFRRKFIIF